MPAKFISICTPSLGMVSIFWSRCVQCITWPMNTGQSLNYLKDGQGGEIAEVRNNLVQEALDLDSRGNRVSHLLWIDDDVLVGRMVLSQLLLHDRDIAAGVYFSKQPGRLGEPLIFPERYGGTDKFVPNRLYEVWGAGGGLMLVKLDVYKRLRNELNLPQDKYGRPEWYRTMGADAADSAARGEIGMENDVFRTGGNEDLYFCDLAGKLGIRPLVDTTKHAFGFHYDAASDKGYPEEQYQQWVKGECIRWPVPGGGEVVWD